MHSMPSMQLAPNAGTIIAQSLDNQVLAALGAGLGWSLGRAGRRGAGRGSRGWMGTWEVAGRGAPRPAPPPPNRPAPRPHPKAQLRRRADRPLPAPAPRPPPLLLPLPPPGGFVHREPRPLQAEPQEDVQGPQHGGLRVPGARHAARGPRRAPRAVGAVIVGGAGAGQAGRLLAVALAHRRLRARPAGRLGSMGFLAPVHVTTTTWAPSAGQLQPGRQVCDVWRQRGPLLLLGVVAPLQDRAHHQGARARAPPALRPTACGPCGGPPCAALFRAPARDAPPHARHAPTGARRRVHRLHVAPAGAQQGHHLRLGRRHQDVGLTAVWLRCVTVVVGAPVTPARSPVPVALAPSSAQAHALRGRSPTNGLPRGAGLLWKAVHRCNTAAPTSPPIG